MPNPDPFFAVADRIAHDFYTKLWRFLYESRIKPSTSNSMYWCNGMNTDGNTRAPDTSPPPGSPNLEKYRNISQNRGVEPEPMIVEVILRLPQRSKGGRLGSTSSQMWQPIILETWNLSLAYDDGLVGGDLIHHLVRMHEEPRYFYWTISIYINRLPTEIFIRQINGPRTSRPPSLPMGLEIALRLSPGSTNDIEKQFAPYGSAPLPIRTYRFLPVPHIYGSFMLSVTCITDSTPLFADREFFIQRSSWLGIAYSSSNLQINGQGDSFPVSSEQAKMPKSAVVLLDDRRRKWMKKPKPKLTSKKFLPRTLKLRHRMMVNSTDGRGKFAERKENLHTVAQNRDVTLDVELERSPSAHLPSTPRDNPALMQSKNLNVSPSCILPSSVGKFNCPTLSLVNALNTDKDVLPPDEPFPNSSSFRYGIPIPRGDHQNAQWWLKHMIHGHENLRSRRRVIISGAWNSITHIIHKNLRSRRRTLNSPSTAGSRPSPMISGASDPITPEFH